MASIKGKFGKLSIPFFKKESGAMGFDLKIYRIETAVWSWDLQIVDLYSFGSFTYLFLSCYINKPKSHLL